MSRSWTMLGAPLDSSGGGRGEERAPTALRAAGLAQQLGLKDAGDVVPPLRDPRRDPATGVSSRPTNSPTPPSRCATR
jgi:arginase